MTDEPRRVQAGMRFSFLVAVKHLGLNRGLWECRCDCGNVVQVTGSYLVKGRNKSCGCKKHELCRESSTKHGMRQFAEYAIWCGMIKRCENVKDRCFDIYGGRGIKVCDAWRQDFKAFFDHIGPRPSPKHSVDRIDNDRGYEPGNVRWATPQEQRRNQRGKPHV